MRSFMYWLGSIVVRFNGTRLTSSKRRSRPSFEQLEDRSVPTLWTWTGSPGSHIWNLAANWLDENQKPGIPLAGDDVKFTAANNVDSILDPGFTPNSLGSLTIEAGYSHQLTLQKDISVGLTTQFDGTIFGSYTYTSTSMYEWKGGTLRGFGSPTSYNTVINGFMVIDQNQVTLDGRNIQNYGEIRWTNAPTITINNTGRINVKPGGLWKTSGPGAYAVQGDGSGRINNEGELRIDQPTSFNGQVNNLGGGTWNVDARVICTGNVSGASGSTLSVEGATVELRGEAVFDGGSDVLGGGTLEVHSLFTTTAGTVNVKAQLMLMAGTTCSVQGTLLISGGGGILDMAGAVIQGTAVGAKCQIAGGAEASIGAMTLIDITLENDGQASWNWGDITLQNVAHTAKINNNATFQVASMGEMSGTGLFNNAPGAIMTCVAASTFSCDLNNLGTIDLSGGTVVVNHNWTMPAQGTLLLNGGNLQVNGTFDLQGTIRTPAGGMLMADLVVNNGNIDMRNGTNQMLSIMRRMGQMTGGSYTQGAGGSLFIEITSNNGCDVLMVADQATLAGTFDVSLGGGYQPGGANPRTWMFLTYGARNGTFGTVNRPANFGLPVYGMMNATITWTPPG